jgi:hypothetical protein
MVWPFKRKSKADAVIDVMDDAIAFASEKWLYFSQALAFKDHVTLKDKIAIFLTPAREGLNRNFPALNHAPDAVHMLIVVKGVEMSGTNTRAELEDTFGIEIP